MNKIIHYKSYDLKSMRKPDVIAVTHENDVDTQFIELHLLDGGNPVALSTEYAYTALMVNRDTQALIDDSVSCTLNESGNVEIPIDNLHTRGGMNLLIELTITDSDGNQVLVTPFPLTVRVNQSILDDAQVTPESQGTVPELLEEAKEALENAGDYESLENKPQINGHELVGNKSSDDLGLQGKLTAGENVTIDENGEISASGGVTINQTAPQILSRSQYPYEVGDLFLYNQKIYRFSGTHPVHLIGRLNLFDKIGRRIVFSYSNPPQSETTQAVSTYDSGDLFVIRKQQAANSQGRLIGQDVYLCVDVLYTGTSDNKMCYDYTWQKIRVEDISKIISSATVNQNGTITFTMSDGSTVTTTGESVIGPQGDKGDKGDKGDTGAAGAQGEQGVKGDPGATGADGFSPTATITQTQSGATVTITDKNGTTTANISNGAPGQNYVLTPQDKTDIANIVLSELPTTQGVQYGN